MVGMMRRHAMMKRSSVDPNLIYEASNIVLTGSNYIDTGFKAYSSENFGRDFKVTIVCGSDLIYTEGTAVVFGCKYEGRLNNKSYPGFYFRFSSGSRINTLQLATDGSHEINHQRTEYYGKTTYISRRAGNWYLQIEDGVEGKIVPTNATIFDFTLLIGAGRQTNGNLFRYTKGTIEYIRIEYI